MGKKWRDREEEVRSRRFKRMEEEQEQRPRKSVTIHAFRSVVPSPELQANLLPVHNCVEEFIDRLGLGGVERVALNGLRLTLIPPRHLYDISKFNPALDHASKVRKHILQVLPHVTDTIHDVPAAEGAVMEDGDDALVALIFDDQRFVDESVAAQEALGVTHESMRPPFVTLSYIPRLERPAALDLSRQLCEVAPQVIASFGPVDFGK